MLHLVQLYDRVSILESWSRFVEMKRDLVWAPLELLPSYLAKKWNSRNQPNINFKYVYRICPIYDTSISTHNLRAFLINMCISAHCRHISVLHSFYHLNVFADVLNLIFTFEWSTMFCRVMEYITSFASTFEHHAYFSSSWAVFVFSVC